MSFTQDQNNVIDAVKLLLIEGHKALVIDGSAGTGKTTIIKEVIRLMNSKPWLATLKVADVRNKNLVLTATTNKAVDALFQATQHEASTVHKALGIRMDNKTRKMVYPSKPAKLHNTLLIIDEYSYIDDELLNHIDKVLADDSSVIFVGDHAQLAPVGSMSIPVVGLELPTIELKQQVRQETSVLKDIGEKLKAYVIDGNFPDLVPDGKSFIHYEDSEHDTFAETMVEAFKSGTARFLSYTNQRTLDISRFLFEELKNRSSFEVGDYAVNNKFFKGAMGTIRTDASVKITQASKRVETISYFLDGSLVTDVIHGTAVDTDAIKGLFIPDDFKDHTRYEKIKLDSVSEFKIQSTWIDLRPQYACTVHKSQGSTYDRVFIDLSDFSSVRSDKDLSRLLYVAMSRARKELHVIGNL